MTDFSALEIQLIRSSLGTRSDEEIAELIECPVESVVAFINDITDGNAEQRSSDVARYKQEQANSRKKKPARVRKKKQQPVNMEAERKKQQMQARSEWDKRREQVRKLENQRMYKTRKLDLENTVSVRLDSKTHALVEIQSTPQATQALIDQVKLDYELRKKKSPLYKE